MDVPRFTKLYKLNNDLEIKEFRYLFGSERDCHYIEDEAGVNIKVPESVLPSYFISKRIALSQAEEYLINKIRKIQEDLRKMDVLFNPIYTHDKVLIFHQKSMKQVHSYDKKTGLYVSTYHSTGAAFKDVSLLSKSKSKDGKSFGNVISEVCRGRRKSAYGYRWSYDKVGKLK